VLVQRGHYVATVCQSLGIHRDTYYAWLETAEQQRAADSSADTPHTRFSDTVKRAEAQAEIAIGESWLEAGDKGWLKYATFASRRFRKHWHDKEPEQHNTFVQNNYQLMPGQAGYVVPELPPAIEADVLSPLQIQQAGEGAQNV
jgi:transposase-like protein